MTIKDTHTIKPLAHEGAVLTRVYDTNTTMVWVDVRTNTTLMVQDKLFSVEGN